VGEHLIAPALLERSVEVLVVGCGGTGSAIVAGLPFLHQAMLAAGHPGGLSVTLQDGDVVSETNCVRQAFCCSEVGHSKADVLASRVNLFYGMGWKSIPRNLGASFDRCYDLVIGCVDTRKARAAIVRANTKTAPVYWLDIGNSAATGQYLLGQPSSSRNAGRRLLTAADMWPEVVNPKLDNDDGPSCSAVEALERQEPFINQLLASHALGLLGRLFRHGRISYRGAFVNLENGRSVPIMV
jgi:PRTRC genetic system ThiF family protein